MNFVLREKRGHVSTAQRYFCKRHAFHARCALFQFFPREGRNLEEACSPRAALKLPARATQAGAAL